MYQYTIQIQQKNAVPFCVNTYDYLDVTLNRLQELINKDKHYNRTFFVNNDFFKNENSFSFAQNKYEILCREVGEWRHFNNIDFFIK